MSHHVRVRGLKLSRAKLHQMRIKVAPRAGAWIETLRKQGYTVTILVAPRAGAWIETFACEIAPNAH